MPWLKYPKCTFLIYFTVSHYFVVSYWHEFRQVRSASYNSNNRLSWFEMTESSLKRFCSMNSRERFRNLLDPLLVPRIVGTQTHDEVAAHLARTLLSLGFEIDWDRFRENTPYGIKPFATLIATFDSYAPKRLVLACHYDSKILEGEIFIGATDSAVPCAMILEMAYSLVPFLMSRKRKDIGLQLIFFDGEEALGDWTASDSIYGARHLAKKWKDKYSADVHQSTFEITTEINRIILLILLDLLGAPGPLFYNFQNYSSSDDFDKLIKIEKTLGKIGCLHKLAPMFQTRSIHNRVEDDHLPFLEHGVPVLHLIPVPFPNVWHKVDDNPSALDYDTIDNLNSILRVFLASYLGLDP